MDLTTGGLELGTSLLALRGGGPAATASLFGGAPVQIWRLGDGWEVVGVLGVIAVIVGLLGAVALLTTTDERRSTTDGGTTQRDEVPFEQALDVAAADVTTDGGRFSREAFTNATGMPPETFVYRFVEHNGGRVKQQRLLSCFPWSKATVSRYLTELEEEGLVERVRSGRENYVKTVD